MNVQVEWKNAPDFAEFAEVLSLPTEHIMAVNEASTRDAPQLEYLVLYTPDYPTDETIWSAFMSRDNDGILQLSSVPWKRPGLWEEIKDHIEAGLREDESLWITGDDDG